MHPSCMHCYIAGSVDLFLKAGAPPGFGARQFDLRPDWNGATGDSALEVVLHPSMNEFRTGIW
jgi:hypothetical protein